MTTQRNDFTPFGAATLSVRFIDFAGDTLELSGVEDELGEGLDVTVTEDGESRVFALAPDDARVLVSVLVNYLDRVVGE